MECACCTSADSAGPGGYCVVGFGACVPQILSLAVRMHAAVCSLNAATEAGAGDVAWRLRVGVARGSVVTGGLGCLRVASPSSGGLTRLASPEDWSGMLENHVPAPRACFIARQRMAPRVAALARIRLNAHQWLMPTNDSD